MKRNLQITIGTIQCLIFLTFVTGEFILPLRVGLSTGVVTDVKWSANECFGEDYSKEATVQLSIYEGKNIPLTVNFLANRIPDSGKGTFLYWGGKRELDNPTEIRPLKLPGTSSDIIERESEKNPSYFSNATIVLFSIHSAHSWAYVIYQFIKWFSIISGLGLLFSNLIPKRS